MEDIFAKTRAAYIDPKGAAAFVAKEMPHMDGRNARAWSLLDGVDWQGKTALDMGCGFGRDVAELRRRGATAYGVDVSPGLLAEAEARYGGGGWVQGDILEMRDCPVGMPVDLVWSVATLVHVPREQMPELLTRWWRWLKPGGRMILISKAGEGEDIQSNLGAGLERVMVFYRVEELLDVLRPLGALVERQSDATSRGIDYLELRLLKEAV